MGRSRSRSRSHNREPNRRRNRSYSRSPSPEKGYRIHIADLGMDPSKSELDRAFEKFGPLIEVWVARNPPCFAFIVYKYREDAERAVQEMDGRSLRAGRIRVSFARPRTRGRKRRGFDQNLQCYTCGENGHFSRDCVDTWKQRRGGKRSRDGEPFKSRRRRSYSRSRSRSRSPRQSKNRKSRSPFDKHRSRSRSPRSRSPRRHRSTSRSPQNSRSRKDSERDRGSVEKKKSESHDKEYRSRSRSQSTGRHADKDVRNRSRSRSRSASVGYHGNGDIQQEA